MTTREELERLREIVSASHDEFLETTDLAGWTASVLKGVRKAARVSAVRGLYAAVYMFRFPRGSAYDEVCNKLRETLIKDEGYTAAEVTFMDDEFEELGSADAFPGVAGLGEVMVTFASSTGKASARRESR
jgi:hypothetical protein